MGSHRSGYLSLSLRAFGTTPEDLDPEKTKRPLRVPLMTKIDLSNPEKNLKIRY